MVNSDITPATDEQIAAWEKHMPTNIRNGWAVDAEYLAAAVARVRQAEAEFDDYAEYWRPRTMAAEAEAAHLREQVERMRPVFVIAGLVTDYPGDRGHLEALRVAMREARAAEPTATEGGDDA